MTDLQWRELVEKTRKGDKDSFEKLYKETSQSVYFTALKMLADEDNAKDVLQDTFMAAIEKLDTLEDGAKFPKWINSIAVNKCRRYFRRAAEESLDEKSEQGYEIKDDESFIPEEYVTDEVKRGVIMDIINNRLSEVQRQTIIMYYYNDMSLEEIAAAMDCPVKTVSSRLCSAREKIREAVLIYEREQGDRLHVLVPVPVLTQILRMEAERLSVPDIPLDVFVKAVIDAAAKASAGTITTGTVAGGSSSMANILTGKVLAGILAVTVAGGGVTAAVLHNNKSDDDDERKAAVTSSVVMTEVQTEVQTTTAPDNGDPFLAASMVLEQEENSRHEFVPDTNEMDPGMKAKLDELRASGAETREIKFGTQNPIPYTDPVTGEQRNLRLHGTIRYFPQFDNGDAEDQNIKAEVITTLQSIYGAMSGNITEEELPNWNGYVAERIAVMLANDRGRLIDSVIIEGLTLGGGADTGTSPVTDVPALTTAEPAAPANDYGDLFFNIGYKEAYAYNVIAMLPESNGKKSGEGIVQTRNMSAILWEEYDCPAGVKPSDYRLQKEYTARFEIIAPENRVSGKAPAEEIKDYLLNGYDYKSIHVNAFDRTMENQGGTILPEAASGSMKIESITDEETVTVLGHEALKIKGYFTYHNTREHEDPRCYFTACIGTLDYEPQGNKEGGLPYYLIIAFTGKDFADDTVQKAHCEKLIDVAIQETYYKDDPNAPKPD